MTVDVGGPPLRTAALALLPARCLANLSALHGHTLLRLSRMVTWRLSIKSLAPQMRKPWSRCATVRRRGYTMWGRHCARIIPVRQERQAPHSHRGCAPRRLGLPFLLLPQLDTLPLAEATHGWPEVEETPAVALLRFLLLVKCCGQPRARRVFSDPLLRDLMGIPPALSSRLSTIGRPAFRQRTGARFWRRSQHGTASVEPYMVHPRFSPALLPQGPVAIVMDGARGIWLWASGYHRQPARCSPRSSAGSWWTRRPRRPS